MKRLVFSFFTFFLFSLSCFGNSIHYIMDTDMGFDDWLAVIYLLKQPLNVDGITIDCAGETRCPAGAYNAAKLTALVKRPVPIAYGRSINTPYAFPTIIRDYATAMAVPSFEHMPIDHNISSTNAAHFIFNDIVHAAKKNERVIIISIGTAENIADAWKIAVQKHKTTEFKKGLLMVYKGGGAFGAISQNKITNENIPGNISMKGILKSDNKVAEWNIYADAPAMQTLLQAGLPVTFIPNNASDRIPITKHAYERLSAHATPGSLSLFASNAMLAMIKAQGGWHQLDDNVDLWDTVATFAALYPELVSQQFKNVPIQLSLTPDNTYAGLFIKSDSPTKVTVDYTVNKHLFYEKLLKNLQS